MPYPVRGARYSLLLPYLDATGTPTDPVTPDTEVSKDGAAFADCTEEATVISGANGMAFLTLTGAETDCSLLALAAKVASGPKATVAALSPRLLPSLRSGTAAAGGASSLTLDAGASAVDDYYTGCILRAGASGSAATEARVITDYIGSTKVATVSPAWEVTPGAVAFDVLLTDVAVASISAAAAGAGLDAAGVAAAVWDAAKSAHTVPNTFGDYLDIEVSSITTGGGGGPTAGDIAAAVLAAAVTAPVAAPTAPYTVDAILGWILAIVKFRRTQSATEESVYADDGSTLLATSAKSDSGSLFTRGEYS